MPYDPLQVSKSKEYLSIILPKMPKGCCLIGGYAAKITVNEKFKKTHMQDYIGSKDIDLGFAIDPNWTVDEIRNSPIFQSGKALEDLEFVATGYRYIRHHDRETGKPISEADLNTKYRTRQFDVFQIWVDFLINTKSDRVSKELGFTPLHESLLSIAFEKSLFDEHKYDGASVTIPCPEILLGMKLRSVLQREEDHKKHKDIADIFSISWYSRYRFDEIRDKLKDIIEPAEISSTIDTFTQDDYSKTAAAMGVGDIDANTISRITADLKL